MVEGHRFNLLHNMSSFAMKTNGSVVKRLPGLFRRDEGRGVPTTWHFLWAEENRSLPEEMPLLASF
jgi:hypothetical protein